MSAFLYESGIFGKCKLAEKLVLNSMLVILTTGQNKDSSTRCNRPARNAAAKGQKKRHYLRFAFTDQKMDNLPTTKLSFILSIKATLLSL